MKNAATLFVAILLLAAVGCGKSDPANIHVEDLTLARDDGSGKAGETVSSFKPADRVHHVTVRLNQSGDSTPVNTKIIAVDAGGQKNYTVIEKEYIVDGLNNTVAFHASLPNDWPVGSYRAEVWVNGKMDKAVDYKVE